MALAGILGLGPPQLNNRIQSLEDRVNVNPEFLVGVQEDIGHVVDAMTSWSSTMNSLSGWQGNLEKEIRTDIGQIKKDVEIWQSLVQEFSDTKKIMESNGMQPVEITYPALLNDPPSQLDTIPERNQQLNDVIVGNHENQVKLLDQVEDLRKTQCLLTTSLGVLGMSALGYLGWKGFSEGMKWYRKDKKQRSSTQRKKSDKVNIKKRLHARDFQQGDGLYLGPRFH